MEAYGVSSTPVDFSAEFDKFLCLCYCNFYWHFPLRNTNLYSPAHLGAPSPPRDSQFHYSPCSDALVSNYDWERGKEAIPCFWAAPVALLQLGESSAQDHRRQTR